VLGGVIASVLVLGVAVAAEAANTVAAAPAATPVAAVQTFPPGFEPYTRAASMCGGLDPLLLVAIHDVETGRDPSGDRSSAGAIGPMQFLPQTWTTYGIDADGDGLADPSNLDDALAGAARLLCADGITNPETYELAIWHYNHSWEYVRAVTARATELHQSLHI
jgi:membrane-bound lytic murein transglycosylase B